MPKENQDNLAASVLDKLNQMEQQAPENKSLNIILTSREAREKTTNNLKRLNELNQSLV